MIALNSRSRPRLSCRRWLETAEDDAANSHDGTDHGENRPAISMRPRRPLNVKRHDGGPERQVLIGMITDPLLLAAVVPHWPKRDGLFASKWSNIVGRWCVRHYRKFGRAPGRDIEGIFREWSDGRERDKESAPLIDRLLSGLSDEHDREPQSSSYLIDLAQRHFSTVAHKRLASDIEEAAEIGDTDKMKEYVREFRPIELVGRNGLIRSADIVPCEVRWLWDGWVPLGELTVIDGDPGSGKSQLTLDIAARLSRGWLMPPCPRKPDHPPRTPGSSIILTTEDAADTVIRPRLDALHADCDRIMLLGAERDLPTFPAEIPWLENKITEHRARLAVLDPFYGFLGSRVESNTDPKIRQALGPLAQVAHRTGCAIVLVRHLNKKSDEPVLYRGGGSIAVLAQCRSAVIVGRDPSDPQRRVLAPNKTSLCRPPQSLAFEIEAVSHDVGSTSRLNWAGEVDLTAQDVVTSPKGKQGRPSQLSEVIEYIKTALGDGEMPATELQERTMEKFDISKGTFHTARKSAGVRSRQQGFRGPHMAYIP